MSIRQYFLLFVSLTMTLSFPALGYCYWEKVHQRITLNAIDKSSLNNSLIKSGFLNGVDEKIKDNKSIEKKTREWIQDGSTSEDEFFSSLVTARYLNHFYDPLNGFGLVDPPYFGTSSFLWASNDGHNVWRWEMARTYLYDGLTKTTKTDRDDALSKAFRAIGQVMHLVQDLAVPAHVRNDAHPTGDPYELWTRGNVANLDYSMVLFPYWNVSISPFAPKQFWDLDSYDGTTPYDNGYVGLAEYTNANFASEDTIFKKYPHPTYTDTNYPNIDWHHPEILDAEDGKLDSRIYIKRTVNGSNDRFASVSYISYDCIKKGYYQYSPIVLDDAVYKDYATHLLPRAVGYSAGLLDYFFRGYISVIPDGDSVSQFAIANNGKEDMTGTFSLYYDDKDNNRVLITSWKNLTVAAESQSSTVTVTAPTTPEPKEKNKYILVFQGVMGNETGAVAGKIVKKWWREEWDNGLTGNHTWLTTDSELLRQNPATGETHNDVISGKLTKENIRHAGNYTTRINQTIIQDAYEQPWGGSTQYCLDEESPAYCVPFDFGTEFPMPITKDTVVRVKIDEMSINENIPYQDCGPMYGGPGGYQGIVLRFDNGVDFAFTVPDQVPFNMKLVSYITPEVETSFNISDAFKNANVEFTEPVNLVSVNIVQQLWLLCAPSATEHRQRLVVDYIRFQEQ